MSSPISESELHHKWLELCRPVKFFRWVEGKLSDSQSDLCQEVIREIRRSGDGSPVLAWSGDNAHEQQFIHPLMKSQFDNLALERGEAAFVIEQLPFEFYHKFPAVMASSFEPHPFANSELHAFCGVFDQKGCFSLVLRSPFWCHISPRSWLIRLSNSIS